MQDADITALAHSRLDFNSPLSDARAAELIAELRPLDGATVVDLGCGWAELLLRLLAAEPTARGIGVDTNPRGLARARANAERRGLSDRVTFAETEAATWAGEPADAAICIGSSHAWGGTRETLEAIRPRLKAGGRLLLGDGFWTRPMAHEEVERLGFTEDNLGTLGELVDVTIAAGYRPLAVATAGTDEWDAFESRWCGGLERWLAANPDDPDAKQVRDIVDEHRNDWLHGYRGILGFAYLTLVRA